MKSKIAVLIAIIVIFLLPSTMGSGLVMWLDGISGILVFSGTVAISILLDRYSKTGYLTISKNLVFSFNFFILVIGVWALVHTIVLPPEPPIHLVVWQLIAGVCAVILAYQFYAQPGALKSIFSEAEVTKLAAASQEIQNKTLIGFWWRDELTGKMKWSAGMYEIFNKPLDWEINLDALESLLSPADVIQIKQAKELLYHGVEQDLLVTLGTDRGIRHLRIKAYGTYSGSKMKACFGSVQDITETVIKHQILEIQINELKTELQTLKNKHAVSSFLDKT